jgi:nucleotidyltransferase substrate binding protein (TIGR01987 family)
MNASRPLRWHQRYDNFRKSLDLLIEGVIERERRSLSDLEQAGIIQRYEMAWELGWKVLRDYLAEGGSPVELPSPANVIRAAFAIGLIADGDGWIAAMQLRNRLSHEYNQEAATLAVQEIATRHLELLRALADKLADERATTD